MKINYPNGKSYPSKEDNTFHLKHENKKRTVIYGNRGMSLEQEINNSNRYYLDQGIAVIHKKPIPIQIVDVDYPRRSAAVIKKAYFRRPSTTDYNGVYNGYYLDFEAKETQNQTAFPLTNFHKHQIEHMYACTLQGGVCFTIIRFVKQNELYLMPFNLLFKYWKHRLNGRKSIPKTVIEHQSFQIIYDLQPQIPYLKYVDLLINQIKGEQ